MPDVGGAVTVSCAARSPVTFHLELSVPGGPAEGPGLAQKGVRWCGGRRL